MKMKKSYGYARLMRILEPSAHRVEPRCPVARQCGGCQIQAMEYEEQLRFKERKVLNHLMRIGGFSREEIPMLPIMGICLLYTSGFERMTLEGHLRNYEWK